MSIEVNKDIAETIDAEVLHFHGLTMNPMNEVVVNLINAFDRFLRTAKPNALRSAPAYYIKLKKVRQNLEDTKISIRGVLDKQELMLNVLAGGDK